MSAQIARLEEKLGVSLLYRTNYKVELTAVGRAFLPKACEALPITGGHLQATIERQGATSAVGRGYFVLVRLDGVSR